MSLNQYTQTRQIKSSKHPRADYAINKE